MKQTSDSAPAGEQRRAHVEGLIAAYPDVSPHQLKDMLHYFKHEATALEVGLVASRTDIAESYRNFRADHLDRLSRRDIIIMAVVVVLIAVAIGAALVFRA